MAMPIIPRPVRGRLYCRIADANSPVFPQASRAWAAADPHPTSVDRGLEQPALPPLRRCGDCQLDLGRDVLRALAICPRWGKRRLGVESRCPAFVAKDGAQ